MTSQPTQGKVTDIQHGQLSCPVYMIEGGVKDISQWSHHLSGQVLIVTEDQVAPHYLKPLEEALTTLSSVDHLVLPAGEATKSINQWSSILDHLVSLNAQRDATIIALGGGVIGDLAGFAAASYMRGIGLIQIPTSLLAQVDAAIGGKTAVNHPMGKNLIGAFHAPKAIIIDPTTLTTLSERDYRAGLAEVIKYGAIGDLAFFEWLETNAKALARRDPVILEKAIRHSVMAKAGVVARDEKESGERALLNFGHTFGHAIEALTDYDTFRHGEAIAIGMVMAARLSEHHGYAPSSTKQRLEDLFKAVGLPTTLPESLGPVQMIERMRLDKKNRDNSIRFVLLAALGKAAVYPIPEAEIQPAFDMD